MLWGTTTGATKGDTRSLEYGSCRVRGLGMCGLKNRGLFVELHFLDMCVYIYTYIFRHTSFMCHKGSPPQPGF